jgi:hypothetical protein
MSGVAPVSKHHAMEDVMVRGDTVPPITDLST